MKSSKYITYKYHQKGAGKDFSDVAFHYKLAEVKSNAHQYAVNLLNKIGEKNWELQIATAESLTAGLIFSTLGDIPFGGRNKYGCFSVYDTDAKRVLLGVTADDVYKIFLEC